MHPITFHTGRGIPLRRSCVDTDQIIPSDYCRSLRKSGYEQGLFAGWRRDPDFVLNDPSRHGASVLVTGPDFGTGSSREHAVWALRDWGIAAVIAPGFGDIFASNALRNGMLAVTVDDGAVAALLDLADADGQASITVDLLANEVRADGVRAGFGIDPGARQRLLDGTDDIDLALARDADITAHEQRRPGWLPRLGTAAPAPVGGGCGG